MKTLTNIESNEIIQLVAHYCGLSVNEITSKGRYREYVVARTLCTYLMIYDSVDFATIAHYVGRKRANIYHYRRLIVDDASFEDELRVFVLWAAKRGYEVPTFSLWKRKCYLEYL